MDGNGDSAPNYFPNTMGGPEPDISFNPLPHVEVHGVINRHTCITEDVDFMQAGELFRRVMDDSARTNLISNLVSHMQDAQENIQYRQTALFYKCDTEYGTRVVEDLGLDVNQIKDLADMTQEELVEATRM